MNLGLSIVELIRNDSTLLFLLGSLKSVLPYFSNLLSMILLSVTNRILNDLYSSLLVNRIWCKVTLGINFCEEYCMYDKKLKKKALCIRTYISCMNEYSRTLPQNGFDLSSQRHYF